MQRKWQSLWLKPAHAQRLRDLALEGLPMEVCGVLGGTTSGEIRSIIPVANIAQSPDVTYYMDERALVAALAELNRSHLELIGFYHSHPRGRAVPSATDIRAAQYPDATYVIIGLAQHPPEIAAWQIAHGRVDRIELNITASTPNGPEPSQSRAEIFAILTAAAIAVLLLIVISLTLLPPAPPIIIP